MSDDEGSWILHCKDFCYSKIYVGIFSSYGSLSLDVDDIRSYP